jgi:hypothetical protein
MALSNNSPRSTTVDTRGMKDIAFSPPLNPAPLARSVNGPEATPLAPPSTRR